MNRTVEKLSEQEVDFLNKRFICAAGDRQA
jgi:hypothetical protein